MGHQIKLVQMMLGEDGSKGHDALYADGRGAGTSLAEVSSVSTQLPLAHVHRHLVQVPLNIFAGAARWVYDHPYTSAEYACMLAWAYSCTQVELQWESTR